MYDLLPLRWSRSGAPLLRCATCCRCFGLEVVPQCYYVRFDAVAFAVALASNWCDNAKMYDLLPLLWSRSGAPMLRCTICCRCFGLEVVPQCQNVRLRCFGLASKWCPNAKMYDLLPLLWSRSGAPILRCTICCRCFGLEVVPKIKNDLMSLLCSRSGAPLLRCAICCRCFGLEVVPIC